MTEEEYLGYEKEVGMAGVPTQVAHPFKATLRTIVAALIALVPLLQALPPALEALADVPMPDGLSGWLLGAAGVLAVAAGAVTRLMAVPEVLALLERLGLGTGAEKE